jgi:hypothetical protein
MVYTIKKLEFKKLEWRRGCKTCIVYTGLYERACCAKMVGKEETPKCRKKTVTWTNEMIEDLIDFIEIQWYARSKNLNSRNLNGDWMQNLHRVYRA